MSAPPPVLELDNLAKTFGRTKVLDNVSFSVASGEVHCLLGHNGSGKSTLIKIVGGYHQPDPGTSVTINGQVCELPLTSKRVRERGVRFVHQSLGLVPSLTVAEHFAQDRRDSGNSWLFSPRRAVDATDEVLREYKVGVDPTARIETLSAADRALVAIVRAVDALRRRPQGVGRGLLVLDEPTAFLPRDEVTRLFETMRAIADQGAGIILVTHDTDEVLAVADRVTVLRDGKVAGIVPRADLGQKTLVRLIVGHELEPKREAAMAQTSFARHAVGRIESSGIVRDLSLSVGRGEILGLTGLIGSGCADVLHALFGSRPAKGRLTLGGRDIDLASLHTRKAIASRIAFIPSDRPGAGVALDLSVAENVALLTLPVAINPAFFSAASLERAVSPRLVEATVRPPDPSLEIGRLSGGNQQKVVLAKWLASRPTLLLLDEPTQGIDIGAREQIFGMLRQLAATGTGMICASTDHDQLAQLCDRVLVLNKGRFACELSGDALTPTRIGEAVLSAPPLDESDRVG